MLTATLSSDVPLPRGRVLRYAADIRPVSMVLGSFLLHLGFYWFASPVVALIAMLPQPSTTCAFVRMSPAFET